MQKYLTTLEEEKTPRSLEEYIGAFTESLKVILQQNPVDRIGHAVLLAGKTALRLKAANPKLKEHEIAHQLQKIARNLRLTTILNDLTPEEKGMLKMIPEIKEKGDQKNGKRKAKSNVKPASPKKVLKSKRG